MTLILVGRFESQEKSVDAEFANTEKNLNKKQHTVLNPRIWQELTTNNLVSSLLATDGVVLLKGWECSDQASDIVAVAHILRKPFYFSTNRGLYQTGVASEICLTPLLPSDYQDIL